MQKVMFTVEEAAQQITAGKTLLIAGDEVLLRRLPRGKWIGGTTPYFMAEDGGRFTRERVLVTELPEFVELESVVFYDRHQISRITSDAAAHGVSFLLIPWGTEVLEAFATEAPEYPNLFSTPLVGWVVAMVYEEIGKAKAWVFDGRSGEASDSRALALHARLPANKSAKVDIYNIFEQGDGDELYFEETCTSATHCLVDGRRTRIVDYMRQRGHDHMLPLVANYSGAMINTSLLSVDEDTGSVLFAAPVFRDMPYRFAKPVADYPAEFQRTVPPQAAPVFSCNCILNYFRGQLEGRPTAQLTGPVTFGEIAYQLLNQTCVCLDFRDV